ncbi:MULTISPECIES: NtrZ family periplasmic regulatory protein [Hyphobacterium]|uniref:NtrZ family periplasmic regulatory protein n=1 Tax=Hyphobacterium vulgare TaxID=1736751 RepID=A0ABV6ZXX2_9PROT
MTNRVYHIGLASVFAAATLCVTAPSAFAFQEQTSETGSAAVQPWYEAFTFATSDNVPSVAFDNPDTQFEFNATERWGFTLGLDNDPNERYDLDSFSAGAFVNVGERFRFGGAVRFTAQEDLLTGTLADNERAPEVKFESALRF